MLKMLHLAWPDCYNVRDVGGYPTTDGKQIRGNAFVRADNVCQLSREGQTALYAYGIRTIIDLRFNDEISVAPNPFRSDGTSPYPVTYFHLPLRDNSDPSSAIALQKANSTADLYCQVLDGAQTRIRAIMVAIAEAPAGGVLVHCQVGKDRTGLITALLLAVLGVPNEIIADDYAKSTEYLRPYYEKRLAHDADPSKREAIIGRFTCEASTMLAVLTYLHNHYHGVQSYLIEAGVTAQMLTALRERFT
jgi:protein-tyrosine phosphatase